MRTSRTPAAVAVAVPVLVGPSKAEKYVMESLRAADERRRHCSRHAIDRGPRELILDRDAILVDERDVRPARDGRDRLRRAQLAYHEVEGHAGVLLGLDSMRTHEVALLTLLLDEYQARQHQAEDGHDHEQLRQAEA